MPKPLKRLSLSTPLTPSPPRQFTPCLAQSSSHLGVACTSRDVVKLLVEGGLELVQRLVGGRTRELMYAGMQSETPGAKPRKKSSQQLLLPCVQVQISTTCAQAPLTHRHLQGSLVAAGCLPPDVGA